MKLTRDNKIKAKQGRGEAPCSGLPTGPPEHGPRGMLRGGDAGTARLCRPDPREAEKKGRPAPAVDVQTWVGGRPGGGKLKHAKERCTVPAPAAGPAAAAAGAGGRG